MAAFDAAAADRIADPVARAEAYAAHVAHCRRELQELAGAGLPALGAAAIAAACAAAQRLEAAQRLFRYRCRLQVLRRPYAEERCGAYPLRDGTHDEVRVLSADASSRPSLSGRRYEFETVEPFVRPGLRRRARAALYLSRLEARRLTAQDLRDAAEAALLGQWGLFARCDIPAGSCLGIYGGRILHGAELGAVRDRRYLLEIERAPRPYYLDGETMLCLANSLYLLDAHGEPAGHPEHGYNAELVRFPARLAYGYELPVPAMFAASDIVAGEELRWNYGLHGIA